MTFWKGICILVFALSQILPSINGFSIYTSRCKVPVSNMDGSSLIYNVLYNKANSILAEEGVTIEDQNGQEIMVGAVVRVRVANLKAYQVPPKARGSFNEKKEFVPVETGGERSTQNLVLPVGMRGVVTKVIDTDAISANFPIVVKFTPGENTDEGYDPPAPFVMHFGKGEIECI